MRAPTGMLRTVVPRRSWRACTNPAISPPVVAATTRATAIRGRWITSQLPTISSLRFTSMISHRALTNTNHASR